MADEREVAGVRGRQNAPEGFVHCEPCEASHHPDYHHKPFRWGRRVNLHMAWLDTKRAARSYWKAVIGG